MIDEELLATLNPDEEINGVTAARLAKVSADRMTELAQLNRIPSRKIGARARIFRVADVVAWATSPARKPGRPVEPGGGGGKSHYPPRKKKKAEAM